MRRRIIKIFCWIGVLCILPVWIYYVAQVNCEYAKKNRLIRYEAGQAVQIESLTIKEKYTKIYELPAFIDAYGLQGKYDYSILLSGEISEPRVLLTHLEIENHTDKELDINELDIGFYGFRNGAWYNGPDILSFTISELYDKKDGILGPGEAAELILFTDIYPERIEKNRWDNPEHQTFFYIVEYRGDFGVQAYECELQNAAFVKATDENIRNTRLYEPETLEEAGLGEENIPENTKEQVTKMGEEYYIDGIGYRVLAAYITDDLSEIPEYTQVENWSGSELPDTADFYGEIEGFYYIFLHYEITSYLKQPYTLMSQEKDMLDLYWKEGPFYGPLGDSWRYFDMSQHKGTDSTEIQSFNQYEIQPGECLKTTVGFIIPIDAETGIINEQSNFVLSATGSMEKEIYTLDAMEFRLKQGGTR